MGALTLIRLEQHVRMLFELRPCQPAIVEVPQALPVLGGLRAEGAGELGLQVERIDSLWFAAAAAAV